MSWERKLDLSPFPCKDLLSIVNEHISPDEDHRISSGGSLSLYQSRKMWSCPTLELDSMNSAVPVVWIYNSSVYIHSNISPDNGRAPFFIYRPLADSELQCAGSSDGTVYECLTDSITISLIHPMANFSQFFLYNSLKKNVSLCSGITAYCIMMNWNF